MDGSDTALLKESVTVVEISRLVVPLMLRQVALGSRWGRTLCQVPRDCDLEACNECRTDLFLPDGQHTSSC